MRCVGLFAEQLYSHADDAAVRRSGAIHPGATRIEQSPNPGTGENGFSGITAIPGGGFWAAGIRANQGNPRTLIEHHP
jgi:hypothetical protein